ncbi:PREDICTED: major facilitator superfamily domain-containing protein 6-like [Cyphomyrmex costatus]|uniref:major facilitator superfamily domain-containing protein 6-like n=1 Tax=Cyphomyrmex costatus TaxID=456900 RepID=UPI00085241BB|nr:PREDICTED: major facilitator superfamily domain-containing protein 6-like [Cyphomyrmex costatus]
MQINYTQLLIKMHYFFFLGSAGPVFPFLQVYGKQLGISPLIIGSINAILPILTLIAKPIFGFIMDYFQTWRKVIFLSLLVIANSCYAIILFLPPLPGPILSENHFQNVSCETLPHCNMKYHASAIASCNGMKDTTCHWICENTNFSMQLSFHGNQNKAIISPDTTCLLNINEISLCQGNLTNNYNCNVTCDNFKYEQCLYTSIIFWSFVLLMCIGEIGFFVFISISDAFCFVILGQDKRLKYGKQRLWGAMGYGVVACLSGYMVDLWSYDKVYKNYIPSMLLMLVFTCIDLICCIKLELPFQSESTTILKDVFTLLKSKSIVIFLCFSAFIGILNSIMRNFLLWYVEDLSIMTGYMDRIKSIEGLIVAAQSFSGEVIFFFLSGKILKKLGYGYTFTLCFICYALRLGLISVAPTLWWVLLIEFFMQGPSYALSFTTVVAYGNVITPTGASGTVQGLVQGMIDGLGFSVGSLVGGILFKKFGGTMTIRIFSVFAAFSALTYFILYILYLKRKTVDTRNNIKWRELDNARKHCTVADT